MPLIVAAAMSATSFHSPPLVANAIVNYGFVAVFFRLGGLFGAPSFLALGRSKTTTNPVHIDRASAVVATGIHRITRNPIYVGLTSLLSTWASCLASTWRVLAPRFLVLFITWLKIISEERAMTTKFGAAYHEIRRSLYGLQERRAAMAVARMSASENDFDGPDRQ
jgi:protein-S-isoprenylcysteine O-methyltransferase Ste14